MVSRRYILRTTAGFATTTFASRSFSNSVYPQRTVTIVVGNAPGGTDDLISRFVADRLRKEWGQPVVVQNRGGGSTSVAGAHVASQSADGYTLLCLISAGINQTVLRDKLSYKLESFVPVVGVGGFPMALVFSAKAKPRITSMRELMAVANSGGGITFASGGVGTMGHLTAMRLLNVLNCKGVHMTYRNNPEGLHALIDGSTQMMFASSSEVSALRGEDKLHVLAVAASHRAVNMPDVPTLSELGLRFDAMLWHGFVAPVGTPADIVAKLADGIARAVNDPEFISRMQPLAFQEDIKTGDALSTFINRQATWSRRVIEYNKISID